jgi:ribosomal protein L37AE/L43A
MKPEDVTDEMTKAFSTAFNTSKTNEWIAGIAAAITVYERDAAKREAKPLTGVSPLALAIRFHEIYERLAPSFGYETRADTKAFDPTSKNGRLMTAVCGEIINAFIAGPSPAAPKAVAASDMSNAALDAGAVKEKSFISVSTGQRVMWCERCDRPASRLEAGEWLCDGCSFSTDHIPDATKMVPQATEIDAMRVQAVFPHAAEAARIAKRVKNQEVNDNVYRYRDICDSILLLCQDIAELRKAVRRD